MRLKCIVAIFLFLFKAQIFAQSDCFNKIEIKQLGVEFCLPDLEWKIEEEDGLKFMSIHKSTLYSGTNTYTLRTERISEDLSSLEYSEENNFQDIPDYNVTIIKKGLKNINGKDFYFSKTHTAYKSKGIMRNAYEVTFYFCKDKIGYALSYIVDDENKKMWTEGEALKIWNSFKIISLPKEGILD